MHASDVVETCLSTNASTSQDDSELSSHTSPPSTPSRGRTRYPDTLARVPLHRRGTSKTYERLEDLLREAGYKETRVFTPESERHTDYATDKHTSSVRGGVGTVVGFLAGLVSRNSSLAREPISTKDSHSQPPSPLAHIKAVQPPSSASSYSFNTSPESLRKHSRFHATQARRNLFPETHGQSRAPNAYMRHQSSSNFSKDAPNAHAYLRHMASAPNIQPLVKRPSSNVSLRSHCTLHAQPRSSRRAVLLTADEIIETDDPPPLPRNWMESVAKALLSGVPETASTQKTSSTLSEATNRPREQRRPPLLCAQVREQRAGTTEGKVSQTSVVCRSAPSSRAGSRVRRTGAEDDESRYRRDDERRRKNKREEESRKGKGKGKRKERDMVPSLARTRVENDEWSRSKYLPATRRQEGPCSSSSSSEDVDDDDEDEEELDLERLLVPARRQASIRSLRKHLHPPSATGSLRGLPPKSPTVSSTTSTNNGELPSFAPDSRQHIWLDDSWGTGRGRRWVVGEEDDDEGDGYGNGSANGAFSASEIGGAGTHTRAGMKRRRGLPGAWAQWGG